MNKLVILALLLSLAVGFTIPETIPVRMTGLADCRATPSGITYPVRQIDFKEYVKGVLPNEWYPTWEEESLRAGAIAVKMFAWSMVERVGYVWDCNWSQVYNPDKRTDATDKAVDDTWIYILVRDDKIFTTYYDDYQWTCYTRGAYDNCMGQWDSQHDAEAGMTYKEILYKYYTDSSLLSTVIKKQSLNTKTKVRLNYDNPEIMKDYLYMRFLMEEHK